MKRISIIRALALATVALALVGCSSGGSGTGGTGTGSTGGSTGGSSGATAVTIQNFAFSPANVEIKVGDSVTWTNQDSATHSLAGDGGIASSGLANGQSYTKKFDTAGTYAYHCSIHPSMTGQVVVK